MLCEILPGLGKHAHSRPMRDEVLKIACQLLEGKLKNALLELAMANGQLDTIVVGDDPVERQQMIVERAKAMRRPGAKVVVFPGTLHPGK